MNPWEVANLVEDLAAVDHKVVSAVVSAVSVVV